MERAPHHHRTRRGFARSGKVIVAGLATRAFAVGGSTGCNPPLSGTKRVSGRRPGVRFVAKETVVPGFAAS
jgi:hypothetical protein